MERDKERSRREKKREGKVKKRNEGEERGKGTFTEVI